MQRMSPVTSTKEHGICHLLLRPDYIVTPNCDLIYGHEVLIENQRIKEVRPWTSEKRKESGLLLSPAFVNAHSHLEYNDLKNKINANEYWPWITDLTARIPKRSHDVVTSAAIQAAKENVKTGIAALGEHSNLPVSGIALKQANLDGRVFQELIVLKEHLEPENKVEQIVNNAKITNQQCKLPCNPSPHAVHTVIPNILSQVCKQFAPISIHVAESEIEEEFFSFGTGPIKELYDNYGISFTAPGMSPIEFLDSLGCISQLTQLVHCCYLSDNDIKIISKRKPTVAHCPRSNRNLSCKPARIADLRKFGIKVGIGLDSAASSGDIDFFDEMRCAIHTSHKLNSPLSYEIVWKMATSEGAESIFLNRNWEINIDCNPDLLLLSVDGNPSF